MVWFGTRIFMLTAAVLAVVLMATSEARADEESYSGLTGAELGAKSKEMGAKKWHITEIKGYAENGVSKYDATWKDGPAPAIVFYFGITEVQFRDHNNDLPLAGFKLRDHSTWKINGQPIHAAIWTK